MTTGEFMSPEQRLRALEELEQRQQRNQRRVVRAVWVSIVVAALVLATIIAVATWQLTTVRREIDSLNGQKISLQTDITELEKQKAALQNQKEVADGQLKTAKGYLKDVPDAQLKEAIDKQFKTAPATAALLPRIYMQILNSADSERAQAMRKALQEAGYLVLGIEYVPKAQALKISDVRYYHKADSGEAEKIVQAMKNAGEPNANLYYLQKSETSTSARLNHFEVWLAHRTE